MLTHKTTNDKLAAGVTPHKVDPAGLAVSRTYQHSGVANKYDEQCFFRVRICFDLSEFI